MPRIVKEPEIRRSEILDAAERLFVSKGYEQMSIRDLMDELQIAKGTVYHYFASKQALLEALVERIGEQAEQLVLPIINARQVSAQEKLVRFFAVLDREKQTNKAFVFAFMRVWYADENALFRQKLYLARVKRLVPWLAQIIQEGVAEGVFATAYPVQVARSILALLEDLGYATVALLLAGEGQQGDFAELLQMGEATADILERMLGMQAGELRASWSASFTRWQVLFSEQQRDNQ